MFSRRIHTVDMLLVATVLPPRIALGTLPYIRYLSYFLQKDVSISKMRYQYNGAYDCRSAVEFPYTVQEVYSTCSIF